MNRASVGAALAITPPVAGTFEWSADNRNLVVRHDLPFDTTTPYTVRLLGTAEDESGGTLDGDFDQGREGSPGDDFVWTFRFRIPNDDFADAQVLQGESGSVTGDNRYAFVEWAEPRWFATPTYAYGNSLWYRWTSPATGWLPFDLTSGTITFDSVLGVATGDRLAELKLIAWNDQYGSRTASRTSFQAEARTDYSVVVAGKNEVSPDGTGSFRLSWYPTPPPGFTASQFSPARGLPGARVVLTGTNFTGATAVVFGSASAVFSNALTNNLDLRLTATVPPDATSGPITVVTPHGNLTSTTTFQVLPPPLSIARLADGRIEVRWPATSDAFTLETSESVPGSGWHSVPQAPRRADGQSVGPFPVGRGCRRAEAAEPPTKLASTRASPGAWPGYAPGRSSRPGSTLIELLAMIPIIGILARLLAGSPDQASHPKIGEAASGPSHAERSGRGLDAGTRHSHRLGDGIPGGETRAWAEPTS